MAEGSKAIAEDQVVVLSDSDDAAASRLPQGHAAPSHATRKRPLTSPRSPTSKRPRIQTTASGHQSLQPTVSSTQNKPSPLPPASNPASNPSSSPRPQPSTSPTPRALATKSGDTPSPSARRRSPTAKGKQTEPPSGSNQQDSDEDNAPLDLAKISSYEYEQVAKLNPVQLRRYEQYRRSDLKNAKVRKLILAINPTSKPTDPYIIAVKGLAKLFVGDIVENALEVKKNLGDKGALQPRHIREAYRRLRREGAVPFTSQMDNSLQ